MNEDDPLLAQWDWRTDASLAAHEFDAHPEWDNYDRAVNTIINGLASAADVLAFSLEMNREERAGLAMYYWMQVNRVAEQIKADKEKGRGQDGGHPDPSPD